MTEQRIRYSDPAFYTVTVAQNLPQSVIELLPNFYYGNFVCKYQDQVTHIEGAVKDQVALSGLLIYLHDQHCVLLSVNIGNLITTWTPGDKSLKLLRV